VWWPPWRGIKYQPVFLFSYLRNVNPLRMRTALCCLITILLFNTGALAQSPRQYYVVIGAFANQNNAVRWADYATRKNFNGQYAINPANQLYYVYILHTTDKRQAFAFDIKVKAETEFKDVWVFIGSLGLEPAEEVALQKPVEQPKEVVAEKPGEDPLPVEIVKRPEPVKTEEPKKEPPIDSALLKPVAAEEKKPEGKPFFFKLVNNKTGQPVTGEIHVMETVNATQYQVFKPNELVYLKAPLNSTGTYQVVTLAPGYQEMGRVVNFRDPASSAAETGPSQEAVINLPVVKVKLGDYIEFANVRFFANSAILQPESKNELDGLVDLMKENQKYKISIHGHCNGDKPRDITTRGKSTEFFATSPDNVRTSASAKELTQLRADIVKDYLVSQGISADRIKTRAEGGKMMIYPPNSTLAARNDRVEIEILKGK